jgi:serine/threonine protein kinase
MSTHAGDEDGTVLRSGTSVPGSDAAASLRSARSGPSDDTHALPVGTRLNEFELTQRIGEGGFSIVYLAWDHSLDRKVALKEYMPGALASRVGDTQIRPRSERHRETFEAGLKSFINEAKLLARFDHPALVKVYRFWEANGTAYLVMPLYEGLTLKDSVRAMSRPPDEDWLCGLLAPLTDALNVIHAEHCYHRDIAPDNIMLLAEGGKPLLLDFGAARRVIGDMTQALTVILKPGYAPVEQYAEVPGMKQGPWTDVYALAATMYWMILGRTPPPSVGRMLADSYEPLTRAAAGRYSARFLNAIDNALAVIPERRTQTIDALRADIGLGGTAVPPSQPQRVDPDATVIRVRTQVPEPRSAEPRTEPAPVADNLPRADVPVPVGSAPAAASLDVGPSASPRRLPVALGVGLSLFVVLAGVAWWTLKPAPTAVVARPAAPPTPTTTTTAAPPAATVPNPTPRSPQDAIQLAKRGANASWALSVRALRRGAVGAAAATEFGSNERWGLAMSSDTAGYLYVFGSRDGDRTMRLLSPARLDATDRRDSGRFELDLGATSPPLAAGRWTLLVLVSKEPRNLPAAGWRNEASAWVRSFDAVAGAEAAPAWGQPSCAPGTPGCEDVYGAQTLSLSIVESALQPPPAPAPGELASAKPPRPVVTHAANTANPGGAAPKGASSGERKVESSAQSAECAQIYQRLSLGESQASLLERAKVLGCH